MFLIITCVIYVFIFTELNRLKKQIMMEEGIKMGSNLWVVRCQISNNAVKELSWWKLQALWPRTSFMSLNGSPALRESLKVSLPWF